MFSVAFDNKQYCNIPITKTNVHISHMFVWFVCTTPKSEFPLMKLKVYATIRCISSVNKRAQINC